jgi:hypothetical protein
MDAGATNGLRVWSDIDHGALVRSAIDRSEAALKQALNRNPLESLVALVLGGAAVYWLAERGRNEKAKTYWDALEYVSTCASVGYSNIFPETPAGKLVATVLFLLGPSLAAKALDHHGKGEPGMDPALPSGQRALLTKLEEILGELKRLNARAG